MPAHPAKRGTPATQARSRPAGRSAVDRGAGTNEVLRHTVLASLLGIGALAVCDLTYARHTQARYFALHVIANLWISLLALPELCFMLTDPIAAMSEGRTNHWSGVFWILNMSTSIASV